MVCLTSVFAWRKEGMHSDKRINKEPYFVWGWNCQKYLYFNTGQGRPYCYFKYHKLLFLYIIARTKNLALMRKVLKVGKYKKTSKSWYVYFKCSYVQLLASNIIYKLSLISNNSYLTSFMILVKGLHFKLVIKLDDKIFKNLMQKNIAEKCVT